MIKFVNFIALLLVILAMHVFIIGAFTVYHLLELH